MLNSTIPIFEMKKESIENDICLKHNLAITEYIAARNMDINIRVDNNVFNSCITGSGLTCRETVQAHIDSLRESQNTKEGDDEEITHKSKSKQVQRLTEYEGQHTNSQREVSSTLTTSLQLMGKMCLNGIR